jgi:hypothetical protein
LSAGCHGPVTSTPRHLFTPLFLGTLHVNLEHGCRQGGLNVPSGGLDWPQAVSNGFAALSILAQPGLFEAGSIALPLSQHRILAPHPKSVSFQTLSSRCCRAFAKSSGLSLIIIAATPAIRRLQSPRPNSLRVFHFEFSRPTPCVSHPASPAHDTGRLVLRKSSFLKQQVVVRA